MKAISIDTSIKLELRMFSVLRLALPGPVHAHPLRPVLSRRPRADPEHSGQQHRCRGRELSARRQDMFAP
jgi:hypothetical protein